MRKDFGRETILGAQCWGDGRFGIWLAKCISDHGYRVSDVADMLYCTRQMVVNHMHQRTKPSFPMVCGYCYVFDFEDDPKDIWELVKEDWG